MSCRRVPTRLRIVIGLVALPALAWSTPLIAGAQVGAAARSPKLLTLPDTAVAASFTGFTGPHDPENEQANGGRNGDVGSGPNDDDAADDSCDDANQGAADSHEGDDDKTEHTGTTLDCGPPPVVGEAPLAVGLPIAGAGVVGAVVLLRRRRPRAVN